MAEPLVLCELVFVELTLAEDDEVCESDVEDDFVCEMEAVALPVVLADELELPEKVDEPLVLAVSLDEHDVDIDTLADLDALAL